MKEIWKDIPEHEGLYQASDLGRIRSIKRNIILKYRINKFGYYKVVLYKNNMPKVYAVHRLVMFAFYEKKDLQVNHINGDKTDNRLINLEYCTKSENERHAYKTGLKRPTYKKIDQYDLQGNYIRTWNSMKEAGQKLNIYSSNISNCCKGRYKTTNGYIWRYHKDAS